MYGQDFFVKGKVVDALTKKGLQYATVALYHADSLHSGTVTSKNGSFKLNASNGNYTATFEYLGYTSFSENITISNNDFDLGEIQLEISTEALNEISVTQTSNTATVLSLNKQTYNVDKDVVSNGGTAINVLGNVPSVTVTAEGIPMIRGSRPKIMINGRISTQTKLEALQNLPASSIQKIEVITNPSARFSGDSSSGIINIVLKKGIDNGLNGSVTGTVSLDETQVYGGATSINYRNGNLNLYTNTNLFHRKPAANTKVKNKYFTNATLDNSIKELRDYERKNVVFETTIGADYYLSDYEVVNIEGTYSLFNGDYNNLNTTKYYDQDDILNLISERKLETQFDDDIYEIAGIYQKYTDRLGELFYAEFSYSYDNEIKDRKLFNRDLYPYQELILDNELIYDHLKLRNTYWFVGYDYPINDQTILGVGYEANLGKIETTFINKIIENGDFVIDPSTSNVFDFKEDWHRGYIQFDQEQENWSYGIGLGIEHTRLDAQLLDSEEQVKTNFTDYFPSFNIDYKLSDNHGLSLSYRRGLQRVDYPSINPFEQRISETTSYVGNKKLLPYYINSIELSFLNQNEEAKLNFNPTLYFRHYDDIWQFVTYENGEIVNGVPKLINSPVNLGFLSFLGAEMVATYAANDWWNLTGTFDLRYVTQEGIFTYQDSNNETIILDYGNTNVTGNAKVTSAMDLPHEVALQVTGEYFLNSKAAYSEREAYAYLNIAANKDLFDNKATISLIATDVFNSNRTKRTRWPDNVISYTNTQWKQPQVLLSFTWRFNQSKQDKNLNFDSKDDEEKY
ncbi:outer membrane beta-barrel family protein [Urechidicola sp. KH5]